MEADLVHDVYNFVVCILKVHYFLTFLCFTFRKSVIKIKLCLCRTVNSLTVYCKQEIAGNIGHRSRGRVSIRSWSGGMSLLFAPP